jgi:uncharacterized protein (DUF58 family)
MWQDALTDNFMRKLDALGLNARAAGRTGAGQRRSRARGGSVEFADFREYVAGDDTRRIDWSAFARFDRLFIRLFLDERDTVATVWLDASASMEPKADVARQLAATLCYLALARFDRAAVNVIDRKLRLRSETWSGRAAFPRVVKFLDQVGFSGDTDLAASMRLSPPPAGGISMILSDMLTGGDWRQAVSFLKYCKQDVVVLQTMSPEELDPAYDGPIRLVSREDEPAVEIAATPAVLEAYRRTLEKFTVEVKSHCHSLGAAHLLVNSSEPLERLVFGGLAASGVVR